MTSQDAARRLDNALFYLLDVEAEICATDYQRKHDLWEAREILARLREKVQGKEAHYE